MAHYKDKQKIQMPTIPENILREYIRGEDTTEALKFAEKFGHYLQENNFTSAKLRGVFGEIDTILAKTGNKKEKKELRKRVALLSPKLAYLVGRENRWSKDVVDNFKKVLEIMIDELLKEQNKDKIGEYYKNFVNFVKAVVAYHKYYGGN